MFMEEFIFDLQRFGEFSNEYDSTLISGTSAADTISNAGNLVTIKAGAGNDSIYSSTHSNLSLATDDNLNGYGYVTIDAGAGNDTVESGDPYVSINGGAGNDSIYSYVWQYVTISGGTGNDIINSNYGTYNLFKYAEGDGNDNIWGFDGTSTLSISGGSYSTQTSGDDIIVTVGDGKISLIGAARLNNVNISGTEADSKFITGTSSPDNISNTVKGVTINALGGNDYIYNEGNNVSIHAGAGNDDIWNYGGLKVSINGGTGDDSIWNQATSGWVDNVGYSTITPDKAMIQAGDGNDYIHNDGSNVTIDAGKGNDSIQNDGGNNVIISSGAGKDYIKATGANSFIDGGADNDYIDSEGDKVTISGGAGKDYIYNSGSYSKIDGGAGDDEINISGARVSISGGTGNDTLYTYSDGGATLTGGAGSDLFILHYYDDNGLGNDVITDYTETDTIQFQNVAVTKISKSGNNIIFKAGDNKLTVKNAADKVITYIDADGTTKTYPGGEDNSWTISGTTAKYGTSGNTLITVKGVKNLDGISLSGDVVTVSKDSLNKKKVTISGDGYTLALGSDVTTPATKKAAWSYKNGTATYKSSYNTAGYKLAKNSKSITYSEATTAKTLATIKGVKSADGLSLSGKVVTVSEASVNEKKITISGDGYTLKLADGLSPSTKKAAWSYKNGTATYKSPSNTAGYKLASNSKSISYSKATTASTLATVKGATSKSGLSVSGKKITLKNSALSKKVTVSGSYEFDFESDYKNATITGSSKADTITARGSKISVNGGKGNDTIKILGSGTVSGGDGADIFYYKSNGSNVIADYAAEDKISIASGTAEISAIGDDLILTVGSGKITITGGANETVTYFDDSGEHTYKKSSDGIKYNAKKTSATLLSSYDSDSFTFDAGLKSLDATKVEQDLIIIGNKKANTITGSSQKDTIDGGAGTDDIKGGKGNDSIFGGTGDDTLYGGEGRDTLWGGKDDDYLVGGAGNDVFLYKPGDGIDRISDYDFQHDTIKLLSGSVDNKETAGEDIVFTVGEGKIIVEKVTYAVIIDGSGTQIPYRSPTKS